MASGGTKTTAARPARADADGDRLCDSFEVGIGSDPNVADTDGDGMEIASVDANMIVSTCWLWRCSLGLATGRCRMLIRTGS